MRLCKLPLIMLLGLLGACATDKEKSETSSPAATDSAPVTKASRFKSLINKKLESGLDVSESAEFEALQKGGSVRRAELEGQLAAGKLEEQEASELKYLKQKMPDRRAALEAKKDFYQLNATEVAELNELRFGKARPKDSPREKGRPAPPSEHR